MKNVKTMSYSELEKEATRNDELLRANASGKIKLSYKEEESLVERGHDLKSEMDRRWRTRRGMKMDNKSEIKKFRQLESRFIGETVVGGKKYKLYEDVGQTKKWAVSEDREIRLIYRGGAHFSTDLATRKAIANAFGLETFRK